MRTVSRELMTGDPTTNFIVTYHPRLLGSAR